MQLADGNSHAVGAEVSEAENASAVGYADESHIFDGPVAEHFLHVSPARDRQIHAPWTAEDVPELETGLADRRVVDDRKKSRRVGHDRAVEKRFVVVEQIDEVDVAIEIGVFVAELLHDPAELEVLRLRHIRNQPDQAQRLTLGLGEGGGLIERRIVQEIDPAFARCRLPKSGIDFFCAASVLDMLFSLS